MSSFTDSLIQNKGAPCTLYGDDGVSNPTPTSIYVTNSPFVRMLGTSRGEVLLGRLPSTLDLSSGQLLAVPALPALWYVLVKQVHRTGGSTFFARMHTVALLALPLALRYERLAITVPTSARNALGEPAFTTGAGTPILGEPLQRGAVHAAYANQNDPLLMPATQPQGPLPAGSTTIYVPLGCGLSLADTITLVEGTPAIVQQVNRVDANGEPYALQLVLFDTAGSGLS